MCLCAVVVMLVVYNIRKVSMSIAMTVMDSGDLIQNNVRCVNIVITAQVK